MPKHRQARKRQERQEKCIKISIYKVNPTVAVAEIGPYLRMRYRGYDSMETKFHADGNCFLAVELKSREMALKAVQESPHKVRSLGFIASPYEQAETLQTSHNLQQQQNEPVTESDRIMSVLPRLGKLSSLSDQINFVYDALSLKDSDHHIRQDFIRKLEIECHNVLGRQVRCCHLYAFGSSVNRLGMQNCDLDLVMTTNGEINADWQGYLPDTKTLINTIKRLLYREQNNFGITGIVPITGARIPLIKFRYIPTNIDCDLSFNRRMGVINSKLIAHVMEFSETAKRLAFTIRLWGKQKNFVGGGGSKINSYSITLMVIFYLQSEGVLPALKLLQRSGNTIRGSGNEGDCFYTHISDFDQFRGKMVSRRQDELLQGFLEFYIRFPFDKLIVSVLHGRHLTPSEYPNFNMKEINVQDPYETMYNTAKGVPQPMKNWLRKCLVEAWLHRSLLCYPNNSGEPWGLQYLFQKAEGPKQPRGQRKHNKYQRGTAAAVPSEVTDYGSGPCLSLVLRIPHSQSDCPTSAYSRVSSLITQTLRDLYGMKLELPQINHPLSETLQPSGNLSRKRASDGIGGEDETASKQLRLEALEAPSTYPGERNDGQSRDPYSCPPTISHTGHRAEAGPAPESLRAETQNFASASPSGAIPIEYYLPYTLQATTKCKSLRNVLLLEDGVQDYQMYASKVRESINPDHGVRGQDFTLAFQPHGARFDFLHLELQDINSHHVDIIGQHLGTVLPQVIRRKLGT